MNLEEVVCEDVATVTLDDTLSISDAGALLTQLRNTAEEKKNVLLDASNVNAIDTASMQLIAAFSRKVQSLGYELDLKNPSETFQNSAHLLGIQSCFQRVA